MMRFCSAAIERPGRDLRIVTATNARRKITSHLLRTVNHHHFFVYVFYNQRYLNRRLHSSGLARFYYYIVQGSEITPLSGNSSERILTDRRLSEDPPPHSINTYADVPVDTSPSITKSCAWAAANEGRASGRGAQQACARATKVAGVPAGMTGR